MARQRPTDWHAADFSGPDADGDYEPTLLRVLVTDRHWQKYPTFERHYRRAAAELADELDEPELKKVTVSPRQFERWYSGKVKTEPYPDACRILEAMFGRPVTELFAPATRPALEARSGSDASESDPAAGGDASDHDIVGMTEGVRLRMADVLVASAKPDIDYVLEGVSQHAMDSIQTPPETMIRRLVVDYDQTRQFLGERLPLRHQRNLYRATAQLSVLIADDLMVLGKPHHAESWHEQARRAADETEDDILRAHVRALAAMLPLYYGEPQVTVRLTQEAQSIVGSRRHSVRALAPTLEALAHAQLGDYESSYLALEIARRSFDELRTEHRAESVFGFSERRWRFYESRTLSLGDDIPSAMAAQERAVALYPPEVVGDRALLQLDVARCMVRLGDIATGLQMASTVLLGMPAEHRVEIFLRYAWNVVSVVPARFRTLPAVVEYCELLRGLASPAQ